MSYEEIDRSVYGSDVFTNGAQGRYAKPKLTTTDDTSETLVKTSEKKKRAPKIPSTITDNPPEESYENGHTDEIIKTKKKNRKTHENSEIQNEDDQSQHTLIADDETVIKPKKKRAPKIESNNENIDPIPLTSLTTEEQQPVKKKKSKAPKATPIEDDFQMIDNLPIDQLDPSTETPVKVKKSKKHKTPKISTEPASETFDDLQMNNYSEYNTNSEFNDGFTYDGAYDPNVGDIPYDAQPTEPENSQYETAITSAYNILSTQVNFSQYVGEDQWDIIHLPKSARNEPKSRIRKILPGSKDDKSDGKLTTNQKGGFLKRIRTGVNSLVRDENNILFGERSNYDVIYFDDEEDGVDTDDLHRYAQRLRELEDTDRQVNPEFLVLRDGKPVYGVHEADVDGKMTLSARKPIYDRFSDQKLDDETTGKKKFLSRLKKPFSRNKDKDDKGNNSPKSSHGTPDPNGKRNARKSHNKTADDDMGTIENSEPLMD